MKYKCLSIAGFDGSAGAGLQADLKTFSAFGCYGTTVLTALPVQNTQGVKNCYAIRLSCIKEQLAAIFEDIPPDAIKIGMLFSAAIIEEVANYLQKYAKDIPLVVDPVMTAKSGHLLLQKEAVELLKNKLIPLATVITPNLPEARILAGEENAQLALATQLLQQGAKAVLLKGGHLDESEANDVLLQQKVPATWLQSKRLHTKNTHGTGCTLSAAITSCLARGFSLQQSCKIAKEYVWNALNAAQNYSVGKGHGPLHHFYHFEAEIKKFYGELA